MTRCPGCDFALGADASFCTNCGLSLVGGKPGADPSKNQTHPTGTPKDLATIGVGRIVDGKYRVDRVLGEGGMGVVYAARALHTDVDVVIKAVRPELAHRKDIRDRTLAEGRALARIDHPNVVQLKTVVVENDELLLVMQFIDGESLESMIIHAVEQRRPLPYDEVMRLFKQVLDGVAAAHAEGVIHRDLKPANILIRAKDGVVKVTDFGIAKPMDDAHARKTDTKGIVGSVHYMAPEQVKGLKDLDRRCDIYSLGVLLFQMLTGRVPFDAENTYDILRMQVDQPLPSVLAARGDVPPAIDGILQRACAKEREHRFSDCADFRRAIDDIPSAYAATSAVPIYKPPGKTVPGEPTFAQPAAPMIMGPAQYQAYGPAPAQTGTITGQSSALPPTRREPSRAWLVPVIAVVGMACVGTVLLVSGVFSGDTTETGSSGGPASTTTTDNDTTTSDGDASPMAGLAGMWKAESGREFKAVVIGDKVEFQVVDPTQFGNQGYKAGEPRFVLHPLPDADAFLVEDRIRPLPPAGEKYDPFLSHSTCMAVWRNAGGEPLRAKLTGDRLDVDFAKIEPTAANFVRDGGQVISCRGLEDLPAKRLPQVLTR